MSNKTKKQILAAVLRAKRRLAKERDNLRELIDELDELDELHDCCDEAHTDLGSAADALSRLL